MRKVSLFFADTLLFSACVFLGYKRVVGNGVLVTQNRQVSHAERIGLEGSYDLELTQGPVTSIRVEADENLQDYILTREENGRLVVYTRKKINLSSDHDIKIYITTPKLEEVAIAGSGNVTGKNKFTGGDKLKLKIAGAGDVRLEVNTPSVEAEIAGTGNITLHGETRDQVVKISGAGDYNADELKAESTVVKIAGIGNVKVFADNKLDVSIAGGGSVFYKGNPVVKQNVAGSGEVKKVE